MSAPSIAMGDRFQGRKYPYHFCPQILRMLRLLIGDAFSVIQNNHFMIYEYSFFIQNLI